ncbi:MAG: hypothetical protein JWM28_1883 [Chitinophagaceae bacterium]|nr:hypothetical protein [Chitinophagaceae bacterium]
MKSKSQKKLAKDIPKTTPLTDKKDIQKSPDKHIDQDFPGFPHGQSKEKNINPKTDTQKKVAGIKKKEPKTIIMDMPEVKDIPGQENIKPPHIREMMDVTISSADEEGEGLLDDINKEDSNDEVIDKTSNVSNSENSLLSAADRPVTEEQSDMKKISLDKTDGADRLNEESDPADMGKDLDIPGAERDDEDELMEGENNS